MRVTGRITRPKLDEIVKASRYNYEVEPEDLDALCAAYTALTRQQVTVKMRPFIARIARKHGSLTWPVILGIWQDRELQNLLARWLAAPGVGSRPFTAAELHHVFGAPADGPAGPERPVNPKRESLRDGEPKDVNADEADEFPGWPAW